MSGAKLKAARTHTDAPVLTDTPRFQVERRGPFRNAFVAERTKSCFSVPVDIVEIF